jgi:uncharacterized membrane protein YjjP (DUF1212 family)
MKNVIIIIAGLLIVIWAVALWGYKDLGNPHLLIILAILLILARIIFHKRLSKFEARKNSEIDNKY